MKNLTLHNYDIYLDMDGVVCDFLKAARDLTGYDLHSHKDWKKIRGTAWKKIAEQEANFWANLPWTIDGKVLWEYLKPFEPAILSAHPTAEENRDHAIVGKNEWIARELNNKVKAINIVEGPRKQWFATEKSILIDDSGRNIKQWKAQGGIGIHHTNAYDTINQLNSIWG